MKTMTIHSTEKKRDLEVPFYMLSENMAQSNHSQTLDRLNERGGMGYDKIFCNIIGANLRFIGHNKDLNYYVLVQNLIHLSKKSMEQRS